LSRELQITAKDDDTPLILSSSRSALVACGRLDATSLAFGRLSALRRRAEAGDRDAQYDLGCALRAGYLPPKSELVDYPPLILSTDTNAEREWKMTLRKQHEEWAEAHRIINAFQKDPVQAIEWLRKAADQKHLYALDELGAMYLEGDGVERNPAEALRCFSAASDDDLDHGEWDPDTVGEMWRKAAYLGHVKSQYHLGCYEAYYGYDLISACSWLTFAIRGGLNANQLLDTVLARMSPDRIAQAKIRNDEIMAEIKHRRER